MLSRGEFLTAYTPYQPEMSQGVLQAIFEYQTVICELTGMDVSNASGYDGTTVAADACFVAKHAVPTGRRSSWRRRLNPQVRQVVKTYAPGFGLEVVEVPHRERHDRSGAAREAAQPTPPPCFFQQPNFFGCLEPAPELAGRAAMPERSRSPTSTRCRSACSRRPARTAARWRSARGRGMATAPSYGGPHYGFFAARKDFIRRMPGRIVGETVDLDGRRAFVLTLQTREQHIRREKATSNITTNQTLLALAGLATLIWLGPRGAARGGGDVHSRSRTTRASESRSTRLSMRPPSRRSRSGHRFRRARSSVGRASAACIPGYALGRDYEGMDDVLLVALTEKRTVEDVDRLANVLEEVCR